MVSPAPNAWASTTLTYTDKEIALSISVGEMTTTISPFCRLPHCGPSEVLHARSHEQTRQAGGSERGCPHRGNVSEALAAAPRAYARPERPLDQRESRKNEFQKAFARLITGESRKTVHSVLARQDFNRHPMLHAIRCMLSP